MLTPKKIGALTGISRGFYGIGMAGIGIQQFINSDFRPVIWPPGWPSWVHATPVLPYIVGALLIAAAVFIILNRSVRKISLLLGGFLLVIAIAIQVPYVLWVQPNLAYHLGLWTDPLKELALSGGAFTIAGLYKIERTAHRKSNLFTALEKFIPLGSIFFSVTLVTFGIDHFLYTDFVAGLVPSWFADHLFWTYFAGVALISSGVAIILEISIKRVSVLLCIMLFLWLVLLHIPRALHDPHSGQGNEITSVFEALAFSGIALGIFIRYERQAAAI